MVLTAGLITMTYNHALYTCSGSNPAQSTLGILWWQITVFWDRFYQHCSIGGTSVLVQKVRKSNQGQGQVSTRARFKHGLCSDLSRVWNVQTWASRCTVWLEMVSDSEGG